MWVNESELKPRIEERNDVFREVANLKASINNFKTELFSHLSYINKSLAECYRYTDRENYEKYVKKGKTIIAESLGLKLTDPRKRAKAKVIEATTEKFIKLEKS